MWHNPAVMEGLEEWDEYGEELQTFSPGRFILLHRVVQGENDRKTSAAKSSCLDPVSKCKQLPSVNSASSSQTLSTFKACLAFTVYISIAIVVL